MPKAKLTLTLPDEVWIGELSRTYPDATFRILAAIPDGGSGVGLAEVESESIDALLAKMDSYEDVTDVEVLNDVDDLALIQFETSLPLLLLAARDSGVPLEMPFELSDGSAVWELKAPSDRLSELGTQLQAFGISFTLESLQQEIDNQTLLTETQSDLIHSALDAGYYDTPRQCSLTDLAEDLGLAKSTASETLHRAEGKIIKQYADHESSKREMAKH